MSQLDLGKLEMIRRWSQYAAGVVFVIFVGLFVTGTIKLNRIYSNIAVGQKTLEDQKKLIENNRLKIESQSKTIASQDNTIKALVNPNLQLNSEQAAQVKVNIENAVPAGNERKISARIYVQIGDEDQRKRAAGVVSELQKKGYIVPGIENVGGKARIPRVSELRYYQTDSVAQEDIKDIVNTLAGLKVRLSERSLSNSSGVRPRHYEIWFGQDF